MSHVGLAAGQEAKMIGDQVKFRILAVYATALVFLGLFMVDSSQVYSGILAILQSPGILLTDYMVVGGVGAALVNSGLVALIGLAVVAVSKATISGAVIAAIFTMAGFALFGKNIVNVWPIFLGVYLFAVIKKEPFKKFIAPALFGTTLAPMVSQLAVGFDFSPAVGVALGVLFGTIAGFILPPLAAHCLTFHKGYNIYNIGVTGGIAGTVFMALFRGYGLQNKATLIWGEGYNATLVPIFVAYFVSLVLLGLWLDANSFKLLGKLVGSTGVVPTDFTSLNGTGATFVNMGLVGLIGIAYLLLCGAELNGPTLGGVLTMVGFGAFGKHIKNIVPIMLGVYMGTMVQTWAPSDPGAVLAALFGTTLAPIAGKFGIIAGVIAGFIHLSVVMNVGFLHGGMNLYNNGFAGGIVAAVMVSVLAAFVKVD